MNLTPALSWLSHTHRAGVQLHRGTVEFGGWLGKWYSMTTVCLKRSSLTRGERPPQGPSAHLTPQIKQQQQTASMGGKKPENEAF